MSRLIQDVSQSDDTREGVTCSSLPLEKFGSTTEARGIRDEGRHIW